MSPEKKERVTLKSPQLARRFAGYFLDRLHVRPKTPVQLAVDAENEKIDQRQQAFFHVNLFRAIKPPTPENMALLQEMKDQFETQLQGRRTMADRFSLFADKAYADHINTLDLGETKKPGCHDEVTSLKSEYHELLESLVSEGVIDGELSRTEAKPHIFFGLDPKGDFVPATRNRDLFSFEEGGRVLSVAKRMTFLVPLSVYETLGVTGSGELYRKHVRKVEALIDAQDAEAIIPVRTVYYAKSKPISQPEDE